MLVCALLNNNTLPIDAQNERIMLDALFESLNRDDTLAQALSTHDPYIKESSKKGGEVSFVSNPGFGNLPSLVNRSLLSSLRLSELCNLIIERCEHICFGWLYYASLCSRSVFGPRGELWLGINPPNAYHKAYIPTI